MIPTLKIKGLLFNSKAVLKAVGRARRKVLMEAGKFIRKTAQQSMPRRKKPSAPGKPPHTHRGQLKKLLFYSFDPRSESTVVGPAGLGKATVPRILEEGGPTIVRMREGRRRVRRRVRIEARPYIGPAFREEMPKFPELWKNSVRDR